MYKLVLKAFCLRNNICKIKYDENEFPFEEKLNTTIEWVHDTFSFDLIWDNNNTKHFEVKLSKDFLNQIIIDLTTNTSKKQYNIELMTLDYNLIYTINIQKNKELIELSPEHNNLRIGKIDILNTDLDFKLFLVNYNISEISNIKEKNIQKKSHNSTKNMTSSNESNTNFLCRKRYLENNYEFNVESIKEIIFDIDLNKVIGNNIRFCLHIFENNYILTIHDMNENNSSNYYYIEVEFATEEEIKKLREEILEKINNIKNEIKEKDTKSINFKILDYKYNDNIQIYNIHNYEFTEKHYLSFINYCYKYISSSIKDIIQKIIKKFGKEIYYLNFIKEIILETLSKFEYFYEYVKFLNKENNNVKNLIIPNKNYSYKEKAEILSSILIIILNSPYFKVDNTIEFFRFTKNSNKNVYLDATKFLTKIINNLNNNSILNKGYIKTFSRIKSDLNKSNKLYYAYNTKNNNNCNNNIFIIELMNLEELKTKLISYLPDMIVRYVNSKCHATTNYDCFSGNILINEQIFIQKKNNFLENDDNKIFDSLQPFIKGQVNLTNEQNQKMYDLYVFRALWSINHEGFGNKPISKINKGRASTPNKTIYEGNFINTPDGGDIVELYAFTPLNINEFEYLKLVNFNPKSLLNENLYIQNSFSNFWIMFNNLEKEIEDEDEEGLTVKILLFKNIAYIYHGEKNEQKIMNMMKKFNKRENMFNHIAKC